MIKIVNGIEVEMTPEEVALWVAEQDSYTPPVPDFYDLPKRILIERLVQDEDTDEITPVFAMLAQQPQKTQELFNACDYFRSTHPMFAVMHWGIWQALGSEERADELLSPED
ncbi:hypothetical protein GCM10011321_31430 [Youhaiella tibetensis]|uniref:Uncharacterized protein n=1 Tax=Paradevosia tibetensis TaxID=1447062 RepID=A0A5B9DIM1_9HYPH|nr:hypothetical protein [Youhaiella tibetensis]QEE18896.1 hypothetical protein FNA67_01300 [Youhaiella tibetensis]GGF38201.1 hypothetical protein GCM10011321_31430 [Youhaiella tibetensis]